jgi:hypothetical protein
MFMHTLIIVLEKKGKSYYSFRNESLLDRSKLGMFHTYVMLMVLFIRTFKVPWAKSCIYCQYWTDYF